jgi:hypothetical protein
VTLSRIYPAGGREECDETRFDLRWACFVERVDGFLVWLLRWLCFFVLARRVGFLLDLFEAAFLELCFRFLLDFFEVGFLELCFCFLLDFFEAAFLELCFRFLLDFFEAAFLELCFRFLLDFFECFRNADSSSALRSLEHPDNPCLRHFVCSSLTVGMLWKLLLGVRNRNNPLLRVRNRNRDNAWQFLIQRPTIFLKESRNDSQSFASKTRHPKRSRSWTAHTWAVPDWLADQMQTLESF